VETDSEHEPLTSPAQKGLEPEGISPFTSAGFEPNPERREETSPSETLLYEPRVLTVARVRRCSPAVSVHKQQRSLKSVTLIYIGDRIPVLFTTEFLFPKTITLLVEKVDLSTSCLKLFVYQKWVLHNLCQCLNKEQS